MTRRVGTLVVAVVVLLAAACGDDDDGGGDSAATTGGEAATTTAGAAEELALSSPDIEDGGEIPVELSCAGEDVSPALEISGVPDDAASLALTMTDPDAGGFVHWLVTDIDPSTTTVAQGEVPGGGVEQNSSFGTAGYGGPCPPPGEDHTYVFTIYALGEGELDLSTQAEAPDSAAVVETLEGLGAPSASFEASFTLPG
jgi:Raf kinase inhibitor-like YbhB/YbcL family protein